MFNLTNLCGFMAYHAEGARAPVFGNVDWAPTDMQPLSWGGSSWDYDGEYGGCDDCSRGIQPAPGSTWQIGFRPESVALHVTIAEAWANGDLRFSVGSTSYQEPMPIEYRLPGSYIIPFDIVVLEDLSELRLFLGRSPLSGDRPFQITDIVFS